MNFQIRKARKEEAGPIHALMVRAYEQLPDKDLFVCDDLEYVSAHIDSPLGDCAVAVDCSLNQIAGLFMIHYPGLDADNLGRDLDFSEEKLLQVVHMDSAVVDSCYRGHGLQQKMVTYMEEDLDQSRYRYLLATVSPDNPASWRSLEHLGYHHVLTKEKYGGKLRRIYCKEIPATGIEETREKSQNGKYEKGFAKS